METAEQKKKKAIVVLAMLAAFDVILWSLALAPSASGEIALYALDVGQGDSGFVELGGGVQMLVDGGPNAKVLSALGKVVRSNDRYIDLVMLSHPQLDHFGGLVDVLKTYDVGMVITSGREGTTRAYEEFAETIRERGIPWIALGEGDRISYGDASFTVLSPSPARLRDKELNETSLVVRLDAPGFSVLFTGDIGAKTEAALAGKYDLRADVLKAPHHGSKFSSTAAFLRDVAPAVATIGVGKNTYGHPTAAALDRLAAVGAQIFRTDTQGTIKIAPGSGAFKVFSLR